MIVVESFMLPQKSNPPSFGIVIGNVNGRDTMFKEKVIVTLVLDFAANFLEGFHKGLFL